MNNINTNTNINKKSMTNFQQDIHSNNQEDNLKIE
jgi:hypothetical protein